MNRVDKTFKEKENILNIYVTAGFPKLENTIEIVKELEKNGADIIEIGIPFSDPLADGPTIQESNQIALQNGISLNIIFNQIEKIRQTVNLPILLMGYYNQLLQYGEESFFEKAKTVGVDGFIIPDMPIEIFEKNYKNLVERLNLKMTFLITPQTTEERVKQIDEASSGFLYVVSSYATTGSKEDVQDNQIEYFKRINNMELKNPKLIGFGISNKKTFDIACKNAQGGIIGSAFINEIKDSNNLKRSITNFIQSIL